MKYYIILLLSIFIFTPLAFAQNKTNSKQSFCNPLNLEYRFRLDEPSRREAADPSVIRFKDSFYMFLSKTGGYYQSKNLMNWKLIKSKDLPFEDYAPTVAVIRDEVYFMALNRRIYHSADPSTGKWQVLTDTLPSKAMDPTLFVDGDERIYLFHGLSARTPIHGVELNNKTFQPVGKQVDLIETHSDKYGWERPGDYNVGSNRRPWLEGAFVTKHNGKYYLEYSVPGTQFKSYADGMYISDKPLGPYVPAKNNPFSYKPEGFISGAGHGSTFQDAYGNYWYAGTMSISVLDRCERRIGLFPAFFDKDGWFHVDTSFGDYPHNIPTSKLNGAPDYQPKYMLLSYNKSVCASSSLNGHNEQFATDENIRTSWSAKTGHKDEWLLVDLKKAMSVWAVQVNLAEVDSRTLGNTQYNNPRYIVEYSLDKSHWNLLLDCGHQILDHSHEYRELPKAIKAKYVRIKNKTVPSGKFAISDLRIFGFGDGPKPVKVNTLTAERDNMDGCKVKLQWAKSSDATGYNIRYGVDPAKLYLNYMVYGNNGQQINSLNSLQDYYFTIDAFNENGITLGTTIVHSPAQAGIKVTRQ